MASVSTGQILLFVVVLVITTGVTGTLSNEVTRLEELIDRTSLDLRDHVRTDVEILGGRGTEVYNATTDNVTVYLLNLGPGTLPASGDVLTVLVDREPYGEIGVTVPDGGEWHEGEVARVEVDTGPLSGAEHAVTVVVNGDREVLHTSP